MRGVPKAHSNSLSCSDGFFVYLRVRHRWYNGDMSRAKNKIDGSLGGSLIKVGPDRFSDASRVELGSRSIAVARSTVFTTELEYVIDVIARERVYRAWLAGVGRRLLLAPSTDDG
jgi:hypothetical protein